MGVPDLPPDLLAFLRAAPRPELPTGYYGEPLALLSPEELAVETLEVTPNLAPFVTTHPHADGYGHYEVPAINLVRGDRRPRLTFPAWLFLWLPVERRYGSYDLDHGDLMTFRPDPTWADIVADPLPFVSASDGGDGPVTIEFLEPWHRHPWVELENPDADDFTPTRVAVIDGTRVTCEADFWREYLDAVKPEGAEHFGRNLAAFRDAVAGGPGWPGDGCLLRVASYHAMKVSTGFIAGLAEIAGESDGFRLVFA